ncbi:hypothetical protein, partial [Shewanella colwelliana]|uniref:hypothetical protein n=1 Tax=Shewanella colwelliana TaxID=23 RepID=UPI001C7CC810
IETLLFYVKVNSAFVFKSSLAGVIVLVIIIYPFTIYFGLLGAAVSLIVSSSISFIILYNKLSGNKTFLFYLLMSLVSPWVLIPTLM